jgi:Flp pilus assembly protein TadG
MAKQSLTSFYKSQSGSAAVEMVLVMPILLALMFGAFELGNYFYSEHVVAKAVRDGARFASRQSFTSFTACSGAPSGTVNVTLPSVASISTETAIRNLVRTGQVASGGTARLAGWTNATTVVVATSCNTVSTSAGKGIYTGQTGGVRIVTVTATVPYRPLFSTLGIKSSATMTLIAQSQAPVVGI